MYKSFERENEGISNKMLEKILTQSKKLSKKNCVLARISTMNLKKIIKETMIFQGEGFRIFRTAEEQTIVVTEKIGGPVELGLFYLGKRGIGKLVPCRIFEILEEEEDADTGKWIKLVNDLKKQQQQEQEQEGEGWEDASWEKTQY